MLIYGETVLKQEGKLYSGFFNTAYLKFVWPDCNMLQDKYEFTKLKTVKLHDSHLEYKKMALNISLCSRLKAFCVCHWACKVYFGWYSFHQFNDPPESSVKAIIWHCPCWAYPLLSPMLSFNLFVFHNIM